AGIVTSYFLSIHFVLIFELIEIITKFFAHLVLRQRSFYTTFCTEFLVERICLLQSRVILRLEHIIVSLDVVEEDIRLKHHLEWTIGSIVILTHLQIYRVAISSYCTQLEIYSIQENLIVPDRNPYSSRVNIDQSANDPTLSIPDLHWLVRTYKQERVRPCRVTWLVLLVHQHI